MQAQADNIITIIVIITCIFLIVIVFLLLYVYIGFYNKRKLLEEKQQLQQQFSEQLFQSQLEVEEETRHRISEELHDNIGAMASLITINLGLINRYETPEEKAELVIETRKIAKDLIIDVKQLSVSLDTNRISDISFSQAIETEIRRLQKQDLFQIDFSITGEENGIADGKHIIVFRICQELLHNIVKHAKPSLVTVTLNYLPTFLEIIINDDGIGFDIEAAKQNIKGSGLINLYNRAKLVGGSLYLKSDADAGTHCTLQVPTTV